MNKIINISSSTIKTINFLSNKEGLDITGKGWSYSFVYSLVELRDIFFAIRKHGVNNGILAFTEQYVKSKIPYTKTSWDSRRVLEIVNALKNFGLISPHNYLDTKVYSFDYESIPGSELTKNEKAIFTDIFFSYYRFKEIASLFIDPTFDSDKRLSITQESLLKKSHPLFSYISNKSYVDSFFNDLSDTPVIYKFPDKNQQGDNNSGLKRFWDVFISWGQQLNIIERFNMKNGGYKLSNGKTFSCSYFLADQTNTIDFHEFIKQNYFNETCIDIADLLLTLCLEHRIRIKYAQELFVDFYKCNKSSISLIRTSEIFIKEKDFSKNDKIFYPMYNDSFVSHIILRK